MSDEVKARFECYEVVVVGKCESHPQMVGREGVVLGNAFGDNGWSYAVSIFGDVSWCFYESELVATGRMMKEEDFYDGTSVRVKVDPKTGEGRIVNHEQAEADGGPEKK